MTMLYQAPWGFLSVNELLRTHPGCGCAGSGEKSALLSFQGEMHAIGVWIADHIFSRKNILPNANDAQIPLELCEKRGMSSPIRCGLRKHRARSLDTANFAYQSETNRGEKWTSASEFPFCAVL
jgi:hypothetical protein